MKDNIPNIDLITVNYNGLPFLEEFFQSLKSLDYPLDKLRVFFVDNGSCDDSLDFIRKVKVGFKLEIIENKKNHGFAKANNLIFPRCSAEYIALLNNDTRVDKEWLMALVNKMQSSLDIGIACSKRMPQEAPRYIDPETLETSWCSGGHCLIRRPALEKIGYFDERFFMYGEDVDLSWRMWLGGYRCVYVPESLCEHHFGKEEGYRLRRLYFHVRNSVLLRYAYGSFAEVKRAYWRWVREGLYLGFKKFSLKEAAVVFGAVMGHILYIPYFVRKRNLLILRQRSREIKDKWIQM